MLKTLTDFKCCQKIIFNKRINSLNPFHLSNRNTNSYRCLCYENKIQIVHFIYLPQKNIFIIPSLLCSMLINIITIIMYGDDLETSSQCCITYLMGLEPFRQISPKKSDFIQSLDRLTQLD